VWGTQFHPGTIVPTPDSIIFLDRRVTEIEDHSIQLHGADSSAQSTEVQPISCQKAIGDEGASHFVRADPAFFPLGPFR
jgi:hypothetical protein